MGDSLTWGWSFPRANLGIRGQTTAQMLERFPRQVSAGAYREVVILGGTNDTLLGLDPKLTLSNLGRMVDLARAAGVRPVLAEIPPIYREEGRYLRAVDALDAQIVRLAADRHIPVVDYASALCGHPDAYERRRSPETAWVSADGVGAGEGGSSVLGRVPIESSLDLRGYPSPPRGYLLSPTYETSSAIRQS